MKGSQIGKFKKTFLSAAVFAVISLLLISSNLIQPTKVSASDIEPLAKKSTPSPSPTHTPTRTPTPTPRPTPTHTPSPTATSPPTPNPTSTPTLKPSPSPISTPTPTLTPTSTPAPTPTPTQTPNPTPSPTPSPTPTDSPTPTPSETPTPTQINTPKPTSTPSPTPSPTPAPNPIFNSKTLQATLSNGTIVYLGVNGITALTVTNAVIKTDQVAAQTTLSLNIIGQNSTGNVNAIAVPKAAVTFGVTPKIYVNSQAASDQGFSQDANNYYVWYKTIFINYELSIVFATTASPAEFQLAILATVVIFIFFFSIAALVLLKKRKENSEEELDYSTYC